MIPVDVQPNLPAARVPYGDARLGVLLARRVWPANPCNGHEQVQSTSTPPMWADATARAFTAQGRELYGVADLAGRRCLIWITNRLDREMTCDVVVHEEGHWAGQDHTDRGPMAADITRADFAPCRVPR